MNQLIGILKYCTDTNILKPYLTVFSFSGIPNDAPRLLYCDAKEFEIFCINVWSHIIPHPLAANFFQIMAGLSVASVTLSDVLDDGKRFT